MIVINLLIVILVIVLFLELFKDKVDQYLYDNHVKGKRWVKMKRYRPIKNGWYLCAVQYDIEGNAVLIDDLCFTYPAILYWNGDSFIDISRQNVFDKYSVYPKIDESQIKDTEFIMPDFPKAEVTDDYCDLTEHVIAWKMEPNVWKESSKVNIIFKGINRQFYDKNLSTTDLIKEMDDKLKEIDNKYK